VEIEARELMENRNNDEGSASDEEKDRECFRIWDLACALYFSECFPSPLSSSAQQIFALSKVTIIG
jgi:hypothetical protein